MIISDYLFMLHIVLNFIHTDVVRDLENCFLIFSVVLLVVSLAYFCTCCKTHRFWRHMSKGGRPDRGRETYTPLSLKFLITRSRGECALPSVAPISWKVSPSFHNFKIIFFSSMSISFIFTSKITYKKHNYILNILKIYYLY